MKKKLGALTSGKTTWRCDSHQGEWSLGILLPQQIIYVHAIFQGEVRSQLADLLLPLGPGEEGRRRPPVPDSAPARPCCRPRARAGLRQHGSDRFAGVSLVPQRETAAAPRANQPPFPIQITSHPVLASQKHDFVV